MNLYRIRRWSEFQHYRDRNPPWVKLHFSLLSSADWVTLDDASRVLAVACMLVASRFDGEIPAADYIQRVAYLNSKPNFKPLVLCGFLEPLADASAMLADARPETETETETETDKRERGADAPASKKTNGKGTRLTEDWGLPADLYEWTEEKYPAVNIDAEEEKFRNHWLAKSGADGVKRDWAATWRNWVIRANEYASERRH